MAARSSPGGFVVATVTNPRSFMATITHPTGIGYCVTGRLYLKPPNSAAENRREGLRGSRLVSQLE